MKKMSEVFELPINHERLEVYGVGHTKLALPEVERHVAHAINHADALAEALEALCIAYEEREYNAIGKLALATADAALASYRGDK